MVAEPSIDLDAADGAESAATSGRHGGVGGRQLVEFELGGENYGVDIADIREIIRYQEITVVPGTPEMVEGIINLRGRVVPIVDLGKHVGLDTSAIDDTTRVIVIELHEALVGVHVDAVTGVVSVTNEQLQGLTADATTDRSDFIEGVLDVDGRLIVLINLQQALENDVTTKALAAADSQATSDEPVVEDGTSTGAADSTAAAEVAEDTEAIGEATAVVPAEEPPEPRIEAPAAPDSSNPSTDGDVPPLEAVTESPSLPVEPVAELEPPVRLGVEATDGLEPVQVPGAKKPAAKKPAAKKPVVKKPVAKKPAAKKPAAKKPAAKKATAKKPAAKKPAAKKPTAKKPAAKKPIALRPAATKTTAKSRTSKRAAAA